MGQRGGESMDWPGPCLDRFWEVLELTGAVRGPGPLTCLGPDSLLGSGQMPGTASRIGLGPQPLACAPAPAHSFSESLSIGSYQLFSEFRRLARGTQSTRPSPVEEGGRFMSPGPGSGEPGHQTFELRVNHTPPLPFLILHPYLQG